MRPPRMSQQLRLALIVDPLTVRLRGGEHATGLARELVRRGHRIGLFGAPPELFPEHRERDPGWSPESAHGVVGFAPHAVIAYDALSPAAWLGARAARRLHVPLILVEAGTFARGTLFERSLWRIGHSLWGAYVRRTAARLIALDPVARDTALKEGFLGSHSLVILHGVDLECFRPGIPCPLVGRHHIGGRLLSTATALDARAGVDVLLTAFARTVGQRGDWSLVIAGRGPAHARLRAHADRLGVASRVHFVGETSFAELAGLYAASTIVAQPSLDDARGALSVLEAMACGAPVIASDLPRLAHLVGEAQCGLLAKPGDAASWTEQLTLAVRSPEARARWGANGLRRAEGELSWSKVAEAFETAILDARGDDRAALPAAG